MLTGKGRTIALIGAGNMGGAILKGWLAADMAADDLVVIDPSPPPASQAFLSEHGIRCATAPQPDMLPDVIILAVKPQIMHAVLPGVAVLNSQDSVFVSIAAGTSIATLSAGLAAGGKSDRGEKTGATAIIRAMPNTPALVGRGITCLYANADVRDEHKRLVDALLSVCGQTVWVAREEDIDAATAISGSGPAYVFHFTECLAKAGTALGLSPQTAMTLARATVAGAGEMLRSSPDEVATLRHNVTSPGGTTAAALDVLMRDNALAKLIDEAARAAHRRAVELSKTP